MIGPTRRAEVLGFEVAEYRFGTGHRLKRHEHAAPSLVLMFDGAFRGVARGVEYALGGGDWILAPAARDHAGTVGPNGSRAILVTPDEPRSAVMATLAPSGVDPLRGADAGRCARRIDRLLGSRDTSAELSLEAAILELYASFADERWRGNGRDAGFVDDVAALLDANLLSPPGAAELSAALAVSPSRLHRAFRRRFGCSMGQWVRARRLQRAAALLTETDLPLSRIALDLGYYDQSHFTTAFRRHYGEPPGGYRMRRGSGEKGAVRWNTMVEGGQSG